MWSNFFDSLDPNPAAFSTAKINDRSLNQNMKIVVLVLFVYAFYMFKA